MHGIIPKREYKIVFETFYEAWLFLNIALKANFIVSCYARVFQEDLFCKIFSDTGLSSDKIKELQQINCCLSK